METIIDNLSYFKCPISNTVPEKTLSLHAVSKIVMLNELEEITNKVRSGAVKKTDKLPYITPSGCFYSRNAKDIVSYSGIVCIDLDDLEADDSSSNSNCQLSTVNCQLSPNQHINSLKQILFGDKFLKPAFIFVSPSRNGLKLFIRIKDADSSFHNDYFNAISLYLFEHYNLTADPACRDIARACFLCHDQEALFSLSDFVTSEDLLNYIPPRPPESPAFLAHFKKLYAHFNYDPDFKKHESNKLNCLDAVHQRAESALLSNGWSRTGIFFTRPGKAGLSGKTATFCVPPGYKIFIFYNFSTNALPFLPNKGYTDCQVISLLEFGSDYSKCTDALSKEYKDEIAAANQHISTSAHQQIISPYDPNFFSDRDISELLDDGEKRLMPRKIIGAFLYEDTTTLLFSRTNYGKSLLVFQFAFAAATGTSFDPCAALCNECEPMKVLVIDLELNDGIIWKRHGAVKTNPHPYMRNLRYLHEKIENKVVLGFELIEKIEHVALAHKAKLVIIDNISKLLPDAVRPDIATLIISMLNRVRLKTGASIMVIGHTTKGNPRIAVQPTDYYGSAMLQNFFSELSYLDMTKDGNFFLCHSKTKYSECYNQTVPVFFRGDQSRVGVGFTFCNLQNLEDIQLPFALEQHKSQRSRNLAEFKDCVDLLLTHGKTQRQIAEFIGVNHSSISRLYKT